MQHSNTVFLRVIKIKISKIRLSVALHRRGELILCVFVRACAFACMRMCVSVCVFVSLFQVAVTFVVGSEVGLQSSADFSQMGKPFLMGTVALGELPSPLRVPLPLPCSPLSPCLCLFAACALSFPSPS